MPGVGDGAPERVEQRRAAPDEIELLGQLAGQLDVDVLSDQFVLAVEQHQGQSGATIDRALPLQEAVEAADRVGLQSAHRPAAVEDADDLGPLIAHKILRV